MIQSQLIALAQCIDKTEWKELHQLATSSYFNSREDVKLLLKYIEHYLPNAKDKYLQKENVWKKIYANKKYDDAAIRYLMFLTQQIIQRFLIQKIEQKDEIKEHILLAREYRKRGIEDKLIESELKKINQLMEKETLKNYDFYYNSYLFHVERHEFSITQQREAIEGFQEFSDALNIYFMAQKLRQGCAALAQSALNKSNVRIDFLPEVLSFVEQKNGYPEIPLIALFYYIYKALSDNQDHIYFNHLKHLLFTVDAQFTHTELRELYLYAINCCIRRINAAKSEYIAEVFDIYRKGLETKALLEGNMLSRYTYNNIVMAGVRLHEFDWTEKFIHDYKPFLDEKFRESITNHAFATFYFSKKEYDKAMDYLQQSEFDDILHNVDARRMLACIYYDLEEFDALDAHLEAFKNYLYRHKNLGYHRENCLNFIRFIRKILALNFSNLLEVKELEKEVLATSQVVEKKWLLEKLSQNND